MNTKKRNSLGGEQTKKRLTLEEDGGKGLPVNPQLEAFLAKQPAQTESSFSSPLQNLKKGQEQVPSLSGKKGTEPIQTELGYNRPNKTYKSSKSINQIRIGDKGGDAVKAFQLAQDGGFSPTPHRGKKQAPANIVAPIPMTTDRSKTKSQSSKQVNCFSNESSSTSLGTSSGAKPRFMKKQRSVNLGKVQPQVSFNDLLKEAGLNFKDNSPFCYYSQAGKDEAGQKKTNQDTILFKESLCDMEGATLLGVMDGHGVNGHFVSSYVKNKIIEFFNDKNLYLGKKNKDMTQELIYHKLTACNHSVFGKFFSSLDEELRNAKFDVHFSGTTSVITFMVDNKLVCSNIGDSRTILVSCDSQGKYTAEPLSLDHKPENPEEKARILAQGGTVGPCDDEIDIGGPSRVWVKGEKYPGIAISRTLGDEVAKTVGVLSKPDIIEKQITPNVCFLVAASDGIWEFLSNEKVTNLVVPFYEKWNAKGAIEKLITEASKCWENEGDAMDDISCIVYFLNKKHN